MLQRAILSSRQGTFKKCLRAGVSRSQTFSQKLEEDFGASVGYIKRNTATFVPPQGTYPQLKRNARLFHSTAISEVEQFTIDVKCLVELQEKATIKFGDNKCFGTRVDDKFEWISFNEFGRLVQKFRNVLAHHNIGKNDKVALISNNRVEWAVAFYAVNGVGGQVNQKNCRNISINPQSFLFFMHLSIWFQLPSFICIISFYSTLFHHLFLILISICDVSKSVIAPQSHFVIFLAGSNVWSSIRKGLAVYCDR